MNQKLTKLLFHFCLRLVLTIFRLDKMNRFHHLKNLIRYYEVLSKTDVTLKLSEIFLLSQGIFPAFGLNMEKYGESPPIQSRCGKYVPEKLRIRTLFTQCLLFGNIYLI